MSLFGGEDETNDSPAFRTRSLASSNGASLADLASQLPQTRRRSLAAFRPEKLAKNNNDKNNNDKNNNDKNKPLEAVADSVSTMSSGLTPFMSNTSLTRPDPRDLPAVPGFSPAVRSRDLPAVPGFSSAVRSRVSLSEIRASLAASDSPLTRSRGASRTAMSTSRSRIHIIDRGGLSPVQSSEPLGYMPTPGSTPISFNRDSRGIPSRVEPVSRPQRSLSDLVNPAVTAAVDSHVARSDARTDEDDLRSPITRLRSNLTSTNRSSSLAMIASSALSQTQLYRMAASLEQKEQQQEQQPESQYDDSAPEEAAADDPTPEPAEESKQEFKQPVKRKKSVASRLSNMLKRGKSVRSEEDQPRPAKRAKRERTKSTSKSKSRLGIYKS